MTPNPAERSAFHRFFHQKPSNQKIITDHLPDVPFGGIWRRPARLDYFRAMWLLETRRLIIVLLFWLKIATFQSLPFFWFKGALHTSRVPFAMWAAPLPRDMLMYLLVPSRIICVSCFGLDYLSFSLSFSCFNTSSVLIRTSLRFAINFELQFDNCESSRYLARLARQMIEPASGAIS